MLTWPQFRSKYSKTHKGAPVKQASIAWKKYKEENNFPAKKSSIKKKITPKKSKSKKVQKSPSKSPKKKTSEDVEQEIDETERKLAKLKEERQKTIVDDDNDRFKEIEYETEQFEKKLYDLEDEFAKLEENEVDDRTKTKKKDNITKKGRR
jgi:hypothetical protein